MTKWDLSQECKGGSNTKINIIHYIDRMKKKRMIISIRAKKII